MIQFYSPDIETALVLPESDSQHCCRVLRMQPGDLVTVVDGKGGRYTCRLMDANPRKTALEIVGRVTVTPVWSNRITVMVAPTKHNDRMEWLVEKLVEIGIDRFVPVKCRNSERKEIKRERLEKIAVSAMKQSLKATLPDIAEMLPLRKAVELFGSEQQFVGYCDDATPRELLARRYVPDRDVTVLIGPEGDFSREEIEFLVESGYVPVTMGDNRLRTETAALVAVDTCHIINQLNLKQ